MEIIAFISIESVGVINCYIVKNTLIYDSSSKKPFHLDEMIDIQLVTI